MTHTTLNTTTGTTTESGTIIILDAISIIRVTYSDKSTKYLLYINNTVIKINKKQFNELKKQTK